jgi:hypothetical protein
MNKSLEEIYKSDSNKSIKDYDFDVILNFTLAHCLNFTLIFLNLSKNLVMYH